MSMKDTPIIIHATTDAAIDNILIPFNFYMQETRGSIKVVGSAR